ncbi:MAG: hypothetical protein IT392_04435 [Nitrospirae bacterium]|nr:hypothetical protein [Nitrospirota bacterium]
MGWYKRDRIGMSTLGWASLYTVAFKGGTPPAGIVRKTGGLLLTLFVLVILEVTPAVAEVTFRDLAAKMG